MTQAPTSVIFHSAQQCNYVHVQTTAATVLEKKPQEVRRAMSVPGHSRNVLSEPRQVSPCTRKTLLGPPNPPLKMGILSVSMHTQLNFMYRSYTALLYILFWGHDQEQWQAHGICEIYIHEYF